MIFNSGMSHAHNYLSLSGGTLTGDLAMDDCDVDVEGGYATLWHPEIVRGTAPASDIYGGGGALKLVDKNGVQIGFAQSVQLANGTEAMQLGVGNSDSSDWNTLAIGYDGNGNKYVNVSGQTAWRNAIDAAAVSHTHDYLPLSGGTLTNDLTVNGVVYSNQINSSGSVHFSDGAATNYYWIGAEGGSYAYLVCVDSNAGTGIQYRFPATLQSVAPSIQFRNYENGEWGSWISWIWSSQASRTANTVLAAPNGSNGKATFRELVAADCSWINRQSEDKDDNVSVANSTWVKIASVTCAAGTWIISGTVYFASNSTGRRYACIHSTTPTTAAQRQASSNCNAVSGAQTSLNVAGQKAPTSSTTYGLYAYQTSGSALNATGFLSAVRIK